MNIHLCNRKYTIVYNEENATVDEVLRYGLSWSAANPINNLEMAMVHAIVDRDALIREAREIAQQFVMERERKWRNAYDPNDPHDPLFATKQLAGDLYYQRAQAFLDNTKESA